MITMIIITLPMNFTQQSHRGYNVGNASSANLSQKQNTVLYYQEGEAWFLSSGAYRLAGEVRHKPQREHNRHQ